MIDLVGIRLFWCMSSEMFNGFRAMNQLRRLTSNANRLSLAIPQCGNLHCRLNGRTKKCEQCVTLLTVCSVSYIYCRSAYSLLHASASTLHTLLSSPFHLYSFRKSHRRNLPVPHFLDWGVQYPSLFRTKKWRICCHLLSTEAIYGDKITIKPCSAGAQPWTPLGELMTLPRPHNQMRRGYFLPTLLPSRL